MLRLKHFDFNVPGGYQYVQPETGMKFDGNTPFKAQVNVISVHRKANNLQRQSREEVAVDLEYYTCNRVPGVCINGEKRQNAAVVMRKSGGCSSCGGRKK